MSVSVSVKGGKRYRKSTADDDSDAISSNGDHGSTNQPPAKIQPNHFLRLSIMEGKKRKLETTSNVLGCISSASPGIIAFLPGIFKWRPPIEVQKNIPNIIVNFNITTNNSRSKRAASSEIDSLAEPAPKKKKVNQAIITATSPPSRKQRRRCRNGRRKRSHSIDEIGAPPAIFAHKGVPINETIAPPKQAKPTASRNKKRQADDSMNEMGASAQKKKVVVDANADMDIDCNKEPNDYYMSSSSEEEEESLAGTFFLPETPMDYSDSSSESDEESSLESTTRQDWVAPMSRDGAATIIQAFARGFSIRTMKPRARPQAELDTTTYGQEWEMEEEEDNDVDYATTSAEDVSFSSEFTEEEANDGDVGGVVDEDEIELAPQGKAVEEKDEIEKEVVADNVQPQVEFDIAIASDADTATSTEDASSFSNTTVEEANDDVEEANDDDSGASLESGEVNEQVSNVLSQIISAVERKERKQRSFFREKARIESTLDGCYWARPTRRRKIIRV